MTKNLSSLQLMDEKIDTMARQYLQAIVDLKIQRNRLAPISKIPQEVLYTIFLMASRNPLVPQSVAHKLEWVNLTYVCHDWRNLALSSPCLWSNPPFDSPRWAKEMLIRSKTANLTIIADTVLFIKPEKRRTLFDAFHTHIQRIKTVEITFPPEITDVSLHLLGSAPNLEFLTLARVDRRPNRPQGTKFVPVTLQPGSLCGMVRLQEMDLFRIGIDWDVHLASSLTSLRLNDIDPSFRPTIAQVWDALERMPLLETLELISVLPNLSTPITTGRTIRLDHLQTLDIRTGIALMESFLQTVIIPSTADINVFCIRDSPGGYFNINGIITSLQQSSGDSMSENECLELVYIPSNHARQSSVDFVISSQHPRGSEDYRPAVCFEVAWSHGEGSEEDYLLWDAPIKEPKLFTIFQLIPFDSVTNLNITQDFNHFSVSALLQTIGSMPHIRELGLELGLTILNTLQSHLHDDSENVDVNPPRRVSFPSLLRLTVSDTFFHNQTPPPRRGFSVRPQDLIDCLTWREQQGVPVVRLDLLQCFNIDECDIERLKDLVDEVKWDGCSYQYIGSDDSDDGL